MIWPLCLSLILVALLCVDVAVLVGIPIDPPRSQSEINRAYGGAYSPLNAEPSTPCPWGESGPGKGEAFVVPAGTQIVAGKRYEA